MKMEFDAYLYGADYLGIESGNGKTGDGTSGTGTWGTAGASPQVYFYMLFRNPLDENDYNAVTDAAVVKPVYNDIVAFDGVLISLTYSATEVADAADSNLKLGVAGTGGQDSFIDQFCVPVLDAGKYDSTNCYADNLAPKDTAGKTDDWKPLSLDPATSNLCVETWAIA